MAQKKKINFTGPSVKDLGIVHDDSIIVNSNTDISNTKNSNTILSNTDSINKNIIAESNSAEIPEEVVIKKDTITGNTNNNRATKNSNTKNKLTNNSNTTIIEKSAYFRLIRNYLYGALANNNSVEIKLSDMQKELGIHPNTLYKHLKTLRESEFIITKRRYSTEVKRRILPVER
jgi:hypothetical protein